jgi:hypothetical protein
VVALVEDRRVARDADEVVGRLGDGGGGERRGIGAVDATPADVKLLMEIRDLLKERQEP